VYASAHASQNVQATVLSHCGQHEAALKLLEPLWHALQSGSLQPGVDEELLLGGCFTLLEVDFALKRHTQIAGGPFAYSTSICSCWKSKGAHTDFRHLCILCNVLICSSSYT